jgi:hypothetical protein
MTERSMIVLHPNDNVAVLLEDIKTGDVCCTKDRKIVAAEDIEFGHKIALSDIIHGTDILKYGEKIGHATQDINCGEWVHVHNIGSERGK